MEARSVVRLYYAMTGLFNLSGSLIWGINTLFLLAAGLSIFQAFAANAAFTFAQVVLEIPTGVVADTRGRRVSFLLAMASLFAGTLWYVLLFDGGPFWAWLAASAVLGLGFTFYSGAVEAWFVDAYHACGGTDALDPIFARSAQIFGISMLAGAALGGLLGSIALWIPYVVRAAMIGVLLLLGFVFMTDRGFSPRPLQLRHIGEEVTTVAKASWKHGWQQPAVRTLMMMSFLHAGFLIWGWYAWQPYFLQLLGKDLIWLSGLIAAAVGLLMIVGNQMVPWLRRHFTRGAIMTGSSLGLAVTMIGVGFAPNFTTAVSLFLLGMVFYGPLGPVKQAAMHSLIPTNQRATILSFDSLIGNGGGVGSQLALARIAENKGYGAGYIVGGAFLMLAVPLAMAYRALKPDNTTPTE